MADYKAVAMKIQNEPLVSCKQVSERKEAVFKEKKKKPTFSIIILKICICYPKTSLPNPPTLVLNFSSRPASKREATLPLLRRAIIRNASSCFLLFRDANFKSVSAFKAQWNLTSQSNITIREWILNKIDIIFWDIIFLRNWMIHDVNQSLFS